RRLVHRHPGPRGHGSLYGICRGKALALAAAVRTVRGFRSVASLLAAWQNPGERALLLAPATRGFAATTRAPHRPAAARGADLPRRHTPRAPAGRAHPPGPGPEPTRGSNALHG